MSTDTSQLVQSMTGKYTWASNLLINYLVYSVGTQIMKTVEGFHEIYRGLFCIVQVVIKSVGHQEQIRHDKPLISQCVCFTFPALHYIAGPVDKRKHIHRYTGLQVKR